MTIAEILELIRAGFTRDDIIKLMGEDPQPEPQPDPQPEPQPEPQPDPQPEPQPEPQPNINDTLINTLKGIQTSFEALNRRMAGSASGDEPTLESDLVNVLNRMKGV